MQLSHKNLLYFTWAISTVKFGECIKKLHIQLHSPKALELGHLYGGGENLLAPSNPWNWANYDGSWTNTKEGKKQQFQKVIIFSSLRSNYRGEFGNVLRFNVNQIFIKENSVLSMQHLFG